MHEGGCQCGAVRYHIVGQLPGAYACHCGECKKQSASAFSFSIPISASRVAHSGKTAVLETVAYSGAVKLCHFCPRCGTRLWHLAKAAPDRMTLKVGTLDDPGGIKPRFHLWVSLKTDGFELDPSVPSFDTQPDDLLAMRERLEE